MKLANLILLCALSFVALFAQRVTVSSGYLGPASGTTGSISGTLVAGGTATGTATLTGPSKAVGAPCLAAPSDGTSLAGLGLGVSVGASVTSANTATVVVTGAVAGTLTAKSYSVTCP